LYFVPDESCQCLCTLRRFTHPIDLTLVGYGLSPGWPGFRPIADHRLRRPRHHVRSPLLNTECGPQETSSNGAERALTGPVQPLTPTRSRTRSLRSYLVGRNNQCRYEQRACWPGTPENTAEQPDAVAARTVNRACRRMHARLRDPGHHCDVHCHIRRVGRT
jgi:hypothetical protein